MKKVLTMLLCVGISAAVFAQSHDRDYNDRNYNYNQPPVARNDRDFRDNRRMDGGYGFDARREHDEQMARINREYDNRIAAVQYDRWMRPRAKAREINRLERERNDRLRECDMRFSKSYDRYDDHGAHDRRRGW